MKPVQSYISDAFAAYRHFDDYFTFIDAFRADLGALNNLRVLEAGSGSFSYLDLNACDITAIDISPEQLEGNPLLATRVCADLQLYENEAWQDSFDLIVCWNVIEHLERPGVVMEKFMRWIKPEGRIVVAFPSPQTLKGRVTKYTPLFIHRLFYKLYLGTPIRGDHRRGPFPTIFAREMELKNLLRQFYDRGFRIEMMLSFEASQNQFVKKYLSAGLIDWSSRS